MLNYIKKIQTSNFKSPEFNFSLPLCEQLRSFRHNNFFLSPEMYGQSIVKTFIFNFIDILPKKFHSKIYIKNILKIYKFILSFDYLKFSFFQELLSIPPPAPTPDHFPHHLPTPALTRSRRPTLAIPPPPPPLQMRGDNTGQQAADGGVAP